MEEGIVYYRVDDQTPWRGDIVSISPNDLGVMEGTQKFFVPQAVVSSFVQGERSPAMWEVSIDRFTGLIRLVPRRFDITDKPPENRFRMVDHYNPLAEIKFRYFYKTSNLEICFGPDILHDQHSDHTCEIYLIDAYDMTKVMQEFELPLSSITADWRNVTTEKSRFTLMSFSPYTNYSLEIS